MKIAGADIERRESCAGAGTGIEPAKICFDTESAARNNRAIGAVLEVAEPCRAGASFDRGNLWRAQAQIGTQISDFISEADLAGLADFMSQIKAERVAIHAVVGQWIVFLKKVERGVTGAGMGRKEPFAACAEWPVELALHSVCVAELEVSAPLRAVARNIDEGEARSQSEVDVAALAAVYLEGRLDHGWRVFGLVQTQQQAVFSVLLDDAIVGGVVLTRARNERQVFAQQSRINRLACKYLQTLFQVLSCRGVRALNPDKLRDTQRRLSPLFTVSQISVPLGLVSDGEALQQCLLGLGCVIAFLDYRFEQLEVERGEVRQIDRYHGISLRESANFAFGDLHAHCLRQHAEDGRQLFGGDRRSFQVDGNHNVGSHFTHHVAGQVVDQAAIHVELFFVAHRRE